MSERESEREREIERENERKIENERKVEKKETDLAPCFPPDFGLIKISNG